MIIINCKKCKNGVEVPDKRYKICLQCKNGIAITTPLSIIKSPTNNIQNVFFLLETISSYLTIYETYNLYQTCKEFQSILSFEKIWIDKINNDFNISYPISGYENINPIKIAIALDTYIICYCCKQFFTEKCLRDCIYSYKKISKTECLDYYKLTEKELLQFQPEVKYNNFYRKYITLFNFKEIRHYISYKYMGVTNFKLFKIILNYKKSIKKQKMVENKTKKEYEFLVWKEMYLKTFNYKDLNNNERKDLLQSYLSNESLDIRKDSKLCKDFIKGLIIDKSVEHIVAIIKLTRILFSYNHIIYSIYNEECIERLEKIMFKNYKKKKYNWLNAVEEVHTIFKTRFSSIRIIY
jgi:hypothetical protein